MIDDTQQQKDPPTITLSVFRAGPGGGNPCTVVRDTRTASDMLSLARERGHECCLISAGSEGNDWSLRFFAPSGEMDMCGHATVAAAWTLLQQENVLLLNTGAGIVRASGSGGVVWISQPQGWVKPAPADGALAALGLKETDLRDGHRVVNAATSRVKTLVPLAGIKALQRLDPLADEVRAVCEALGSTGLYPWAQDDQGAVHARQFPMAAGYREDPATGIAAAALFYALATPKNGLAVRQGDAMGRPSLIQVCDDPDGPGCLIGGQVCAIGPEEIQESALQ